MKKVLWIVGILFLALILLGGSFSAGLVTGRLFAPEPSPVIETVVVEAAPEDSALPLADVPVEDEAPGETEPPEVALPEDHPPIESAPPADSPTPDELGDLFSPFWEAWDILHERYVDQPLDDNALMQAALEGMLDSLGDPYTSYMSPDDYFQAFAPIEGTYEGIGAWVDTNSEYLTIVSPMAGSPAEEAGLLPGDEVIAINGEDQTGIDANIVVRSVLGPAGTEVILTIRREGTQEPFDVPITRATITIPSIEHRMLEDEIGYIHILQFGSDTQTDLENALTDLIDQDARGLIIDLRNNGGGLLYAAVQVASNFLPGNNVVLYEEHGDGTRETYKTFDGGIATEIPLVFLVNGGTASASEIVSGAIQDYGRAPLVGTTTFGKGLVQNWIPLSDDNGAVSVTIARWLTPNERLIQGIGLDPEYPLAVITQAAIDEGFDVDSLGLEDDQIIILNQEQIQDGFDPQLDKAVEVMMDLLNP